MQHKRLNYILLSLGILVGIGIALCNLFIPILTPRNTTLVLLLTLGLVGVYITANKYLFKNIFRGAPFVRSNSQVIEVMLELAKLKPSQKVADLGSGDGKILKAFAKTEALVTGYEINPILILMSQIKTKNMKNVSLRQKSFWDADLSKYDVITVFGIGYIMENLEEKLNKECKPGVKIITNMFPLPNTKPVTKRNNVYLYILKN